MAFEMSFTDEFGEMYTNSYWRVAQVSIDRSTERGLIMFNGYVSSASAGKRIIGQKHYIVDSGLYNTYFLPEVLDPVGQNPYRSAYLMALVIKDVAAPVEGDPAVSFFENATQA